MSMRFYWIFSERTTPELQAALPLLSQGGEFGGPKRCGKDSRVHA